jgi:hypothetical protein
VGRALRVAPHDAVNADGSPTFPVLHRTDERGEPVPVTHGDLPSMHSFRHTVASRARLAGESVDEIAFLLGHRGANVTRAVYVWELPTRAAARCGGRGWSPSSATSCIDSSTSALVHLGAD